MFGDWMYDTPKQASSGRRSSMQSNSTLGFRSAAVKGEAMYATARIANKYLVRAINVSLLT
jgi:hypothetical protein